MSKKKMDISKQRQRVHKTLWDKREDPGRTAAEDAEIQSTIPWDAIRKEPDSKRTESEDSDLPQK